MVPCIPSIVIIVARTQKGLFIVECVLRLMAEGDIYILQGDGDVDRGEHRHRSAGTHVSAAVECNPHLWQSNNAGLVNQKASYAFGSGMAWHGMVSPLPCCGVVI